MRVIERTGVDPAGVRRILIRGVNWVGDAVMTTPAIAGIRKTFPRAQISLLVKPWVAGVFAGNPHIDEILIYDGEGRHRGVTGLLQLARELREARLEALADRLVEDLGVKVLLTGAKVDGAVARAVRSYARYPQHVIDLIGRTDIQLLAAGLGRCAVFVTIDTGSMHLGAAVGVPLGALFG